MLAACLAASIPALLAMLAIAGAAEEGQTSVADFFMQIEQGTVTVAGGCWGGAVTVGLPPLPEAACLGRDLQVKQIGLS